MKKVYTPTKGWIKENIENKNVLELDLIKIMFLVYNINQSELKDLLKQYLLNIFKNLFKLYLDRISIVSYGNRKQNNNGILETITMPDESIYIQADNIINDYMTELCTFYTDLTNGLFTATEINNIRSKALSAYLGGNENDTLVATNSGSVDLNTSESLEQDTNTKTKTNNSPLKP